MEEDFSKRKRGKNSNPIAIVAIVTAEMQWTNRNSTRKHVAGTRAGKDVPAQKRGKR